MPTEEKLAYEITLARHDLEQNIADLGDAVADEIDLGKQAQRVVDVVKENAARVAEEQMLKAKLWFGEKRREMEACVRANPVKAAAIGVGSVAAVVGLVWLARRPSD